MLGWLVHLYHFLFHLACLLSVTSNRWGKEERQYQISKPKQYREGKCLKTCTDSSLYSAGTPPSSPLEYFFHTALSSQIQFLITWQTFCWPSSLPLLSVLFNLCGQMLLVRRHIQLSKNSWCYIKHIGRCWKVLDVHHLPYNSVGSGTWNSQNKYKPSK